MATGTVNLADLLENVVKDIYGLSYKKVQRFYPELYTEQMATKLTETDLAMSDFGYAEQIAEGQGVSYDVPNQLWKQAYTQENWGKGFIITWLMYKYDLHNVIKSLPAALVNVVYTTIDQVLANPINNGFDTNYLLSDGKPFFSTTHPLTGGGTWANTPAIASDLSMASMEEALIGVNSFVDFRGKPINVMNTRLVIPKELEWKAKVIMKSQGNPETADRADNPFVGVMPKTPLVHKHVTDPDFWGIHTDVPNGFKLYWGRKPDITKDNDFDTENAKFKCMTTFKGGVTDPRCMWGNPGA